MKVKSENKGEHELVGLMNRTNNTRSLFIMHAEICVNFSGKSFSSSLSLLHLKNATSVLGACACPNVVQYCKAQFILDYGQVGPHK